MRHLLTMALVLFFINSFSQFTEKEQKKIDSLNLIANNPSNHDTSLAEAYVQLTELLYVSNLDTMPALCFKTEKIVFGGLKKNISEKEKNSLLVSLGTAQNNLGYYYFNKGEVQKSIDYILASIETEQKINDNYGMAYGYNNIASIYYSKGQDKKALEYSFKSLKI